MIIEITRTTFVGGELVTAGSIIDLPEADAKTLVRLDKARKADKNNQKPKSSKRKKGDDK